MNVLKSRLYRKVIVTTKQGHTFAGALTAQDRQALVLRNAELADPKADNPWITADGEVVILLPDVSYIQVL